MVWASVLDGVVSVLEPKTSMHVSRFLNRRRTWIEEGNNKKKTEKQKGERRNQSGIA